MIKLVSLVESKINKLKNLIYIELKLITFLLSLFFCCLGLHKFYVQNPKTSLTFLFVSLFPFLLAVLLHKEQD
ncbi:NINE protein [Borreliella americana]|uniref:NINE protein n=1 Tax=Borreliella americana TaxID=478807 RepID=UPI001E53C158|nr:NINE protein [Borreliella americana]MCD2349628.1 TM2 domain-containing protein [Borreliella americana]MCD2382389.1 TM2 domain-containing protein [Borreliella americana]